MTDRQMIEECRCMSRTMTSRLDAGHDRLAQIAAEPVLTTLRPAAIAWVPNRKGVMTITHRRGLMKLNFDRGCHFCTKSYYYSAFRLTGNLPALPPRSTPALPAPIF